MPAYSYFIAISAFIATNLTICVISVGSSEKATEENHQDACLSSYLSFCLSYHYFCKCTQYTCFLKQNILLMNCHNCFKLLGNNYTII